MKTRVKFGPSYDTAFFDEISAVFARHPEAARRYSVRYIGHMAEVLGVDLDRQVGVSRIRDGRITTEFVDRDSFGDEEDHTPCCEWTHGVAHPQCISLCKL